MNILFISGKLEKGGGERVISILANHFAKNNRVRIITLLSSAREYELDDSIEVLHLSEKDRTRFLKLPYWIFRLSREFKKMDKDNSVIVSFIARVNIVSITANIFTKIPIIISERNDPKNDGRGILANIASKLLYKRANRIIFQSEYAKSLFSEKIREKGQVLVNPVGPFEETWRYPEKKTIINAGRLAQQKNQEMLIHAFAQFWKNHPKYTLHIYGEGPLGHTLMELIKSLDLESSVCMKGVVSDIHIKMAESSMFVLSSDYEGQSNALLEAMALGMPCITTEIPGHRGIADTTNSVIVPVGDINALTMAMTALADDPERMKRLGKKAGETMKSLESGKVQKAWENVLKGVSQHG